MSDVSFSQATQRIDDDLRTNLDNNLELDAEDLADIFCILHPTGAQNNEADKENVRGLEVSGSDSSSRRMRSGDMVLRLSTLPKDPVLGYCFGRGSDNDFPIHDPERLISHTHFRIYINEYGTIMLEDASRNGTFVEGKLLKSTQKENDHLYRHTLDHGTEFHCATKEDNGAFRFIVRIPRREGEVEEMYETNLEDYFTRLNELKLAIDRKANPSPPMLFPHATSAGAQSTDSYVSKAHSKVWKGGKKYNVVRKIGQGAFATVYKITKKDDGKAFAAKELNKRKLAKDGKLDPKVSNELKIMTRIRHDHVVDFVEYLEWGDYLYIIMEMIPGGDLGQMLQAAPGNFLKEDQVRDMTIQLLDALQYLHDRGIAHRDIKPDNIMLSNHDPIRAKLTDFGLSKMVEDNGTFMDTFCGTLLYCAPEVYREFVHYDRSGNYNHKESFAKSSEPKDRYGASCDLWSLAGVLFLALCGTPPFTISGTDYQELLHVIMTSALDIRPLQNKNLSENCIKFLKAMLQKWPEHRPSIEKLKAHAWLTGMPSTQASTQDSDQVDTIDQDRTEYVPTEFARSRSELRSRDEDGDGSRYESLEEVDRNNLRLSLQRSFEMPSSVNSPGSSTNESYAFMKNGPNRERLFGELGSSALGSSGAMPDRRLDLSLSSFGNAQSRMASNIFPNQSAVESDANSVIRNENGALLRAESAAGFGSPSMLGTEFDQLQVRSPSAGPSPQSEMAGSPEAQSLEGNAHQAYHNIPSFVTAPSPSLRRRREDLEGTEANEPVAKRPKVRPGDNYLIDKTIFWDPRDMSTWHDDYPIMTFAEYTAKQEEAKARGEVYKPPRTTDTPKYSSTGHSKDCISPTPSVIYDNKSSSMRTASATVKDDEFQVPRTIVAKLVGEKGTALPSIVINITEQYTSWGRGANTHVYPNSHEIRVGKWAVKLILLNPGKNAEDTLKDPDSTFYIASKATAGLKVNGFHVPCHIRNSFTGELRNWVQLRHGDLVSIWDGKPDAKDCVRLRFQCYFGASSKPRTPEEPVALLPEGKERAELEAITARRDQEILEERRRSQDSENPPISLEASAVIPRQSEVRAPTPSLQAPEIGRAGIDKRVARLRVESGVSPKLRQTFDNAGSSSKDLPSNKSAQGASANQEFAVQPSAANRRADQFKDSTDKQSSGGSATANLRRQMSGKTRSTGSLNTAPLPSTSRQPARSVRTRKGPSQPVPAAAPGRKENESSPASEATTEHA